MDPLANLKEISNIIKKYNDLELMKRIVDLQTEVFELQTKNLDLKQQLGSRESVKRTGPHGFYFQDGDPDPLCPKCWEKDEKMIHLGNSRPWSGGIRRDCHVCNQTFWEKPMHHAV